MLMKDPDKTHWRICWRNCRINLDAEKRDCEVSTVFISAVVSVLPSSGRNVGEYCLFLSL